MATTPLSRPQATLLTPVDFYFDFSSPYGYLAAEQIDALCARHGRKVNWRPILLGPAFKATGGLPFPQIPLKGDYALRDFARSARFYGIPFYHPENFPVATHHAARAFLWLAERDAALARSFGHAVFRAYFSAGRNISEAEVVLDIASALGAERAALIAALADPQLKERLRHEVDQALARGVFGSPFFIVDNEPFWGVDRLPQLERWLAEGGF